MAEKPLKKQPRGPGRRFEKGTSGNPRGKPKGTRARITLLGEQLLNQDAKGIVAAVISAAKIGDPTAMRLCIERLLPVRKGRPLSMELPKVNTTEGVTAALSSVIAEMADGKLTPDEAASVSVVIESQRRAIETNELASRIERLEARMNGDGQ